MARGPFPPQLVELPLLGAVLGFTAAMMGISGADIYDFQDIRSHMRYSRFNGFVNLEDNGILQVDLLMLIAGAIGFLTALIGLFLAARQFGKRRGEYSGKGTGAWLIMGLLLLAESGLWAGTAAAYTAFTVTRKFSFSRGPNYSEPFNLAQQAYLRSIFQQLTTGVTGPLTVLTLPGATGIDGAYLGEWGTVYNIDQANALPNRYLDYSNKWKAATAISWFALGSTFLVMVVHFALPFVWKWLGLLRQPKHQKGYYNEV
ncbi:hypothetical protein BDZ90DRAFT_232176 [Jaminaea rosea]|uniref:Uncharacterized protein n=1 Tax=Jaminaea rosea TaxID=1569628 RepID=A0A316UR49_9BASI|nr:hypothetical protein BDZ90DRAFT_232176 [Jaminaea rosea]PWN27789.1 hypothetical protein BDZ90DRAFT_232176 [Jaminaea rosea]